MKVLVNAPSPVLPGTREGKETQHRGFLRKLDTSVTSTRHEESCKEFLMTRDPL